MTREETFEALEAAGAVAVTVEFAGGNDEGFAEDPITVDELGRARALHPRTDELARALQAPVYDEFGGFGGEFYVSGTLTWDVPSRRVTMDQSLGEMVYNESTREL